MSYVTGAHNMKFGYQGGFSNPTPDLLRTSTRSSMIRINNGVPNRLTADRRLPERDVNYVRNLVPTSFYAQDQWTAGG